LTFSDYLIVCIPLANIEKLFHPAKRITFYFGSSFAVKNENFNDYPKERIISAPSRFDPIKESGTFG